MSTTAECAPPSSGQINRIYAFDKACLGISAYAVRDLRRRRAPTVTLSVDRVPFKVFARSGMQRYEAAVFGSLFPRRLDFSDSIVASCILSPDHPSYFAFRALARIGVLALPREAFASVDEALRSAYALTLTKEAAYQILEDIIAITLDHLPPTTPVDPRIEKVIEILKRNVDHPLDALAASVHLSYYRLSHLFAESVGIPLRSYQLARKADQALRLLEGGYSQSEAAKMAGLSSLSHLYRVCSEAFGMTPSFIYSHGVARIDDLSEETIHLD